jgi:hypothetical protein
MTCRLALALALLGVSAAMVPAPPPPPANCDGPNGLISASIKRLAAANAALTAANSNMTNTTKSMNADIATIVAKEKIDNGGVIAALNASNAANIANNSALVNLENAQNRVKDLTNECAQVKCVIIWPPLHHTSMI